HARPELPVRARDRTPHRLARRHRPLVAAGARARLAGLAAGRVLRAHARSLHLLVPPLAAQLAVALALARGASLQRACRLAGGDALARARDPDQPDDRVRTDPVV